MRVELGDRRWTILCDDDRSNLTERGQDQI